MDQICHVSQIYEKGEEIKYQPRLDLNWLEYFEDLTKDISDSDGSTYINLLSANQGHFNHHCSIMITSTSQFTRRQLKLCDDFEE
jgi:hypothetical protein